MRNKIQNIRTATVIAATICFAIPLTATWAHPAPPNNGVHLAADIVHLVGETLHLTQKPTVIVKETPKVVAPVIVTTPTVVTTTPVTQVVTTPATTTTQVVTTPATTTTQVVTTPTTTVTVPTTTTTQVVTTPVTTVATEEIVEIPAYTYKYYLGEYVPYYEGWFFDNDAWLWGGIGVRPAIVPKWRPAPRHHEQPRNVIVITPRKEVGRHEERKGPVVVNPPMRHENARPATPPRGEHGGRAGGAARGGRR